MLRGSSTSSHRESGRASYALASIVVGLLVLMPFVAFAAHESTLAQRAIEVDLVSHGRNPAMAQWNASVREAIGTVIQVQNFWANSENVTEAEFRSFVGAAMGRAPSIVGLHVINPQLVVEWSEPGAFAEGISLARNESWALVRDVNWAEDARPLIVEVPALFGGDVGYAIVAPLRLETSTEISRMVVADIPAAGLLNRVYPVPPLLDDFHVSLSHEGWTFDSSIPASAEGPSIEVELGPFPTGVRALATPPVLRITPTSPHLASQESDVALYSVLVGVVVASGAAVMAGSAFRRRAAHVRAQARVQASEAHYRELFENAGEAILVIDKSGRVVDVNPSGQTMLGRSISANAPLSVDALCPPADVPAIRARLQAILETGVTESFSGRLLKHSGRPVEVFGALSRARQDGGDANVIACLVDVTRMRELEDELRQANQAWASKVGELDSFAHTVAHDLRSPLRAITVYAEDLVEDNEGILPEEGREQVGRITENVDRMRAMLDALLQYARAGGGEEVPDAVSTQQLVEEVREEIAPLISAVDALVHIAPDLPDVMARRIPLKQVFTNLITNAIKHNDHPRPQVNVTAERDGEKAWAFTISDNGPGVSDPEKDRVFALFARGGSARSEGSGVGLAIVRRIIESHGGRIQVRDAVGGGAAFRFTLPDVARRGMPSEPAMASARS